MLSKKLVIFIIVIVLAIVVAAVWLVARFLVAQNPAGPSRYSMVYLSTGDIYFGKLSWFPKPKLRDVWFIQREVNPETQETQIGLNRFESVFWRPMDKIYLNPEEIVFWTRLRSDSEVARAIANQRQLSSGQAGPQVAPGAGFEGPPGPPPSQ